MPVPLIMPKVDMDQEKATIIAWLKQNGDAVTQEETVLTVETEKVAIDISAPATGTLVAVHHAVGEVVPVAQIIGYILLKGETLADLPSGAAQAAAPSAAAPSPSNTSAAVLNDSVPSASPVSASPGTPQRVALAATAVAMRMAKELGIDLSTVPAVGERITREDVERFLERQKQAAFIPPPAPTGKIAATPAARNLARQAGIPLESLAGSGPDGRIQARDVPAQLPTTPPPAPAAPPLAATPVDRPADLIPLVGMRQRIAERLQASFQDAPHISLTVEVDVTRLEAIRQRMNEVAQRSGTSKVSLTAVLLKIIAWALARHPFINSSLIGDQIHLWKDINLGVATALPEGLIVPVIHQANLLSIRQIADRLADLSSRARENKLTLSEVQRGTFTVSNLGMFGIRQFRAVINPPESAILAVGTVVRKPVVVDEQDTLAVRPIMSLTLAADHRVVDGVVAARFLSDLVEGIEFPETLLF